jgi:biopolymer transport protein TolQ
MDPILAPPSSAAAPPAVHIDPLSLLLHASGPVRVVNCLLVAAAVSVWIVAILKWLEIARYRSAERSFEAEAVQARSADQLVAIARGHGAAPGARVVLSLAQSGAQPDLVEALTRRALVREEQRAGALLGVLSTIGSAAPFVGLFGTVWGILDAFLRIGREKSASLPVVAPAIGEALIATAVGLFAAIPAVVAYNVVSKRADDLLARLEASSGAWAVVIGRRGDAVVSRRSAPAHETAREPGFPAPLPAGERAGG